MDSDLVNIKVEIATLTQKLSSYMTQGQEFRLNAIKCLEKNTDEIVNIRENCIKHLSNNILYKEHLEDHKRNKNVFRDRRFQIIMFLSGCAWALVFMVIQNISRDINGKLSSLNTIIRTDTNRR